jgi:hypothetical protein
LYLALLADLRRFVDVAREDYFGEAEPYGSAHQRALAAITELEAHAAEPARPAAR